jgi:hypothetical protein
MRFRDLAMLPSISRPSSRGSVARWRSGSGHIFAASCVPSKPRLPGYHVRRSPGYLRAAAQFRHDAPAAKRAYVLENDCTVAAKCSLPAQAVAPPFMRPLGSSSGVLVLITDSYGPLIELGIWSLSANSHFRP